MELSDSNSIQSSILWIGMCIPNLMIHSSIILVGTVLFQLHLFIESCLAPMDNIHLLGVI